MLFMGIKTVPEVEDFAIIFLVMAECINRRLKMLQLTWLCIGCLLELMANVGSHWLQLAVPQFPLVFL